MKTTFILAALGVLAIPAFALASTPQELHGAHDGNVTRQQAAERADQMFRRADANRDGQVTRTEAQRVHQQMSGNQQQNGGGHASRRAHGFFETMFGNRRAVNQAEFRRQHLTLFARMDRNRDGVVAPEEHRQSQRKH